MAFQVITFTQKANHEIEYAFLCQSCGRHNEAVKHIFRICRIISMAM